MNTEAKKPATKGILPGQLPIMSLKGIIKAEKKEEKEQANDELVESDKVDEALKQLSPEDLALVWDKLVNQYQDQASFQATLRANKPKLVDGLIKFNVSNQVQFDDFKIKKQGVYDFLRAELGVQNIRIDLQVKKSKTGNVNAYTDRDKFKIMVKQNPMLRKLKDEFGLEPDF